MIDDLKLMLECFGDFVKIFFLLYGLYGKVMVYVVLREKNMIEEDFIMQGPLYMTQKAWIHPENHEFRSKPENVLWTSPVNPETGESKWMEWCRNESYRVDFYSEQRWHIVPKEDCRILKLTWGSKEMRQYAVENIYGRRHLDFEAIAKDYDALYVPEDTMFRYNRDLLDGWDVATCIFLAPKYTVMDDETYALYKAGKIKPSEKGCSVNYDPEVNIDSQMYALPPLKFKQPVDFSVDNAITELQKMADECSKRSSAAKERAQAYRDMAQALSSGLVQNRGFEKALEKCDTYWNNPLNDHPEILEVLLRHGMNPDSRIKSYMDTKYHITNYTDNPDSVKLLLQYGANPDAALDNALKFGNPQMLKLSLAAGANPSLANGKGVVPLMRVWEPQQVGILLAAGANPLAVDKNGKSVKKYFEEINIYNYRVINCKMLDLAIKNLYIHEKVSDLRKTLGVRDDKNIAVQKKLQPQQKKVLRWEEKRQSEKSI